MLLHASRDFAKRYRCEMSLEGAPVTQSGRLDAWSAHFIRLGRTPLVLVMNDATLWSIILPAKGVTTFAAVLPLFLDRVAEIWHAHGAPFDPGNQQVLVLRRTNRSLIGSMNDAIRQIRYAAEDARSGGPPLDWTTMEKELNDMPYQSLELKFPRKALAWHLSRED